MASSGGEAIWLAMGSYKRDPSGHPIFLCLSGGYDYWDWERWEGPPLGMSCVTLNPAQCWSVVFADSVCIHARACRDEGYPWYTDDRAVSEIILHELFHQIFDLPDNNVLYTYMYGLNLYSTDDYPCLFGSKVRAARDWWIGLFGGVK
jgi:hypothetical protein